MAICVIHWKNGEKSRKRERFYKHNTNNIKNKIKNIDLR